MTIFYWSFYGLPNAIYLYADFMFLCDFTYLITLEINLSALLYMFFLKKNLKKLRALGLMGYLIFCCLQLKAIRICGPRYWPQVIDLVPEGMHLLLLVFANVCYFR